MATPGMGTSTTPLLVFLRKKFTFSLEKCSFKFKFKCVDNVRYLTKSNGTNSYKKCLSLQNELTLVMSQITNATNVLFMPKINFWISGKIFCKKLVFDQVKRWQVVIDCSVHLIYLLTYPAAIWDHCYLYFYFYSHTTAYHAAVRKPGISKGNYFLAWF